MITTTVPAYRGPILALIAFPLRYTREAAAVVGSLPVVVVVAGIVLGYPQSLLLIPERFRLASPSADAGIVRKLFGK